MLFSSLEFIIFFLPATIAVYWLIMQKISTEWALTWLIVASLFFYSWWKIDYLPLILFSIIVNFAAGQLIGNVKYGASYRKWLLSFSIVANLSLLGYFKYYDFFISNIALLTGSDTSLLQLILPLGISFFTFQQIAYLVDAYRGICREYNMLHYSLFVTFFPQLIAGPIVHHKEMLPQFTDPINKHINYNNWARGSLIFIIGLVKKVVIADAFAQWANWGFDQADTLTLLEAWATSLSYTMQLYFDFSAYCDMAIGAALFFNIRLPTNFNSPYKSSNIQEFWRCWHITLGRFIKEYIYIPLGGNQGSGLKVCITILITFTLCGLWHGAGWGFLFWGWLHGMAILIFKLWGKLNKPLPKPVAVIITFLFINVSWVFFRATDWHSAIKVIKGMCGFSNIQTQTSANNLILGNESAITSTTFWYICLCLFIVFFTKNSIELSKQLKLTRPLGVLSYILAMWAILTINETHEFIYFNF